MAQEHDLPLDEYHRAGIAITNGNPDVYKSLYSRAEDVTLANPFGPPAVVGATFPPPWTVRPRSIETAKPSNSRTYPR